LEGKIILKYLKMPMTHKGCTRVYQSPYTRKNFQVFCQALNRDSGF